MNRISVSVSISVKQFLFVSNTFNVSCSVARVCGNVLLFIRAWCNVAVGAVLGPVDARWPGQGQEVSRIEWSSGPGPGPTVVTTSDTKH